MFTLTPAMVHQLALLVYALATLVKALWPNSARR
jgi:hypothetical protein